MKTKASIARETARKKNRRSYTGRESFSVRRAARPSTKREVKITEDEKERSKVVAKLEEEQKKDLKATKIKRFLGKPKVRLEHRARELESIDVAPAETIWFGSEKALEAYRRDLYAVNSQKTAHFRTQRRGLSLTIWRDG